MNITRIRGLAVCVAIYSMALPLQAAFMVEAHSSGLANANFSSPNSTPMNSIPSTAIATTATNSIFGGVGEGPDTYIYSYTPGTDADNVTLPAGTDLGNGDLAAGLTGGVSGLYNVYITWPLSSSVSSAGARITITSEVSDIVLDPVDMNSGGTGNPGGSNAWLRIAENIPLTQGNTYTVTQVANEDVYISQRSHGVLWEVTSLPDSQLLLTDPNGGEKLFSGTTYVIQWNTIGLINNVRIEYSIDKGSHWTEVDPPNVGNNNSYDWVVPSVISNQCLVKISNADNGFISDTSDDTFMIVSCKELLLGDLNGDCFVNLLDWALMAQNWLKRLEVKLYDAPLDNNPNWTTEGQWAFGQPTGNGGESYGHPDPDAGYTGTNVYGVNLNGDYSTAVGGPYYLTAGPFNCRHYENMKLKFARWLNSDAPEYVINTIEVSKDGSSWQRVWENPGVVTDENWQEVEYEIGSVADDQETVYIRWGYQVLERAYPYSGWNIDDVQLWGNP